MKRLCGRTIPVFFPNGDDNLSRYSLAGSSGVPFEVAGQREMDVGSIP